MAEWERVPGLVQGAQVRDAGRQDDVPDRVALVAGQVGGEVCEGEGVGEGTREVEGGGAEVEKVGFVVQLAAGADEGGFVVWCGVVGRRVDGGFSEVGEGGVVDALVRGGSGLVYGRGEDEVVDLVA